MTIIITIMSLNGLLVFRDVRITNPDILFFVLYPLQATLIMYRWYHIIRNVFVLVLLMGTNLTVFDHQSMFSIGICPRNLHRIAFLFKKLVPGLCERCGNDISVLEAICNGYEHVIVMYGHYGMITLLSVLLHRFFFMHRFLLVIDEHTISVSLRQILWMPSVRCFLIIALSMLVMQSSVVRGGRRFFPQCTDR
jgi:hypothetical protein